MYYYVALIVNKDSVEKQKLGKYKAASSIVFLLLYVVLLLPLLATIQFK
jgi:hypothetical protein